MKKIRSIIICIIVTNSSLLQSQIVATITDSTMATCNGNCNGSATVATTGGSGNYVYSWNTSPTQTTAVATALCAGTYSCTVSDAACIPSGTELFANGDFEAGNTGFSSSYTFTPPPNTSHGQYWIATGAQISSWNGGMYPLPDHTSGTGNVMMVNGSSSLNATVWCQTIAVNTNTTYLFSTWLSSIHNTNPAQLQFSINGNTVGSIFNAPVATGVWAQFFTSWNSGVNTSANVCIVNQNTSGGGNDFALDDISFQECVLSSSETVSVTISEPDSLLLNPIASIDICKGSNTTLTTLATGGNGDYTYSWLPSGMGDTNSVSVSPISTTTYSVTASDSSGCISPELNITVNVSDITASFVPSVDSGTVNLAINFNNTSTDADTYIWNLGNGNTSVLENPTNTYTSIGTYIATLIAINTDGCSDTTSAEIEVVPVITTTEVTCNGDCDGTANVLATTDLNSNFAYTWLTFPAQQTATATNLCAGSYTCVIIDTTCHPSGFELVPNGNFDGGNVGFSSSYTYTTPPNTNEGQYWVATGAQVSSWNGGMYAINDHTTGTPNGNVMMINAAPTPNVTIWCQTASITANTDYLFSTWVSSIHPTYPAQLQFSINGIPIGDIDTAESTPGVWTEFFASWNSGINTSANICIVNQNTSTSGNDFAIDDISFQECIQPQPVVVTVSVTEPTPVVVDSIPTVVICETENVVLTAVASGGNGGYNYTWQPTGVGNTASVTVYPDTTSIYTVSVTDALGCVATPVNAAVINGSVNASFISSVNSGVVDLLIELNNTSSGATDYIWDLGESTSSTLLNPTVTYTVPDEYIITLVASNSHGCSDTASHIITAEINSSVLWVPNVFTPNDDGINDLFYVKSENINNFNAKVFNRWGQILFEWTDLSIGWDGTYKGNKVSDGTYVYVITASDINDTELKKTGIITLLNEN
jgi:gliding motility-associated-like protein